ncbi:MAG TPA: YcnI family protein [Actinomycetota bacterium]|nr:YcnI family protein [Actinomycetota bacterium]
MNTNQHCGSAFTNSLRRVSSGVAVVLSAVVIFLSAGPAGARVVMMPRVIHADTFAEVSLRVLAGCVEDGKPKPTKRIEMRIPAGVALVRPFPKPGWTIETDTGELREPVRVNDQTLTRGVRKVTWRHNNQGLSPVFVEDLSFVLRTPAVNLSPLVFRTTQFCTGTKTAWTQRLEPGEDAVLERPAPFVRLINAKARGAAPTRPEPPPGSSGGGGPGPLTYLALTFGLAGLVLGGVALSRAKAAAAHGPPAPPR